MDFDVEKLLAKVSGQNTENFASRVISDVDKSQIEFAFNQMFNGLSLLHWMQKLTLAEAWKIALDEMRDFIFGINEKNYIVDYLHNAVFEYRTKKFRDLERSVHAREYFVCDSKKCNDLKQDANEKIQNAIDIIMNIVLQPKKPKIQKIKPMQNIQMNYRMNERENERGERTRK